MPSSKSSLDNRDIYYRLTKSSNYRARSAYKLLHLDEEFDLFRGVETGVDLCAAPGSWSQVLSRFLRPGKEGRRVVALDLQPMAPLPNVTILQTDITLPCTIPLVLNALDGRKADLVVCDGAPDVTGVHDLDAYLHSQLLLAALTLSLTLMSDGATLIFKIFLSPLDPKGSMLRSQLRCFFPNPPGGDEAETFGEFDEDDELSDKVDGLPGSDGTNGKKTSRGSQGSANIGQAGYDKLGRRGGVWVRKPRSSRKGSGEAFIVCRNFDSSQLPLPTTFSAQALAELEKQTTGTITLDSLAQLMPSGSAPLRGGVQWERIKAYVGSGDLGEFTGSDDAPMTPRKSGERRTVSLSSSEAQRSPPPDLHVSQASTSLYPSPVDPLPSQNPRMLHLAPARLHLDPTRNSNPTHRAALVAAARNRAASISSNNSDISPTVSFNDRPWDRPSPLPSPGILYPSREAADGLVSMPQTDVFSSQLGTFSPTTEGQVSPALSSGSKTDLFFASSASDLPTPPKALGIGKGLLHSREKHERSASVPGAQSTQIPEPRKLSSRHTPTRVFSTPQQGTPVDSPTLSRLLATVPDLPLSTLPTLPSIAPKVQDHHLEREHREIGSEGDRLRTGDVLTPIVDGDLPNGNADDDGWILKERLGEGAFSSVWAAAPLQLMSADLGGFHPPNITKNRVAAIKLLDRAFTSQNARTKIAFIREVEVLRHISHPNIVTYLSSFSTRTHHCLVLERLVGGELFELMADEANRKRMIRSSEDDVEGCGFVRRVFGEVCLGLEWLHGIGVVHRDIKLENILLTINPFTLPPTRSGFIPLDLLPTPLVKITDFGLSRFIDPTSLLLQTRCGSESFAAPEIIMGKPYDGRQTDVWALGIVLYALITGELPFDRDPDEERKKKMMRIAKGQYSWPLGVGNESVKRLVGKMLRRNGKDRIKVAEVWEEEWMIGPGSVELTGREKGVLLDFEGVGEVAKIEMDED